MPFTVLTKEQLKQVIRDLDDYTPELRAAKISELLLSLVNIIAELQVEVATLGGTITQPNPQDLVKKV